MNNDQNNSIFGIPNQVPTTTPETNSTTVEPTIPGANVTPITNQAEPMVNNITPEASPVTPGDNNIITPSAIPATEPVNQELKVENSSPFDIGIESANSTENTQAVSPTMPTDNLMSNPNVQEAPLNNMAPSSNNSSDSVPLTSTSNNTENNDNIVSVKKYLGYIVLFSIPTVGFIIQLIKAFGDKKDKNISNLAKAQLLLTAILTGVIIIIFIIAFAIGGFAANATKDYINDSWNEITDTANQDYNYDYSTDDDYNTDYDYSDATDYNTDTDYTTDDYNLEY